MDIFPTILHSIGYEAAWKGFGVNLFDLQSDRKITPERAYELSDKMIRTNFFEYIP